MSSIDQASHALPDFRTTRMYVEAAAAPDVVQQQLGANRDSVRTIVDELRKDQPRVVVTCARGSSDHAATYLKYVLESRMGLITSSAAPSVQSVYHSKQQLAGALYIVISQSGASPDLIDNVERARQAGARILVLTNDELAPVNSLADYLIPLRAGTEASVAATKSYIATLAAVLQLIGHWANDPELQHALDGMPDNLRTAWQLDWSKARSTLAGVQNCYVIARGLGLGIAQEAALKLKEVCGMHAEAFSAAEVRHGPMALIKDGFPVLVLAQDDETRPGIDDMVRDFRAKGASLLFAASGGDEDARLPVVASSHPVVQPVLTIQSFYRMAAELAVDRGFDPDNPPHLRKVTRTV